ncbi:hypothetical protein MVEN_00886500 [Mycena venus]|uniref:DUF6818 domain-containing protein n=1 Tax=Mycena venus TaxID=2733690 RepID=A0A8H6YC61_9AGAR|nr:hypothetical protein MVEN_00886500 [Mycena venus]
MSDPTAPPFTQLAPKYNIFYDGNGTAWHHNINGQWVPAPREAPIPPPQTPLRPSFELRGAPTTAQHAPPQSTTYGFLATPSAQPVLPHLIDPRLLPLPRSDDRDLGNLYTIAKASLCPATKVGSIHQKDKGKKRQLPSDSSDDSNNAGPVPKRGRPQGSSNYNKEYTKVILKIIEKVLPIGSKGWGVVTLRFNKYAVKNNRPERDVKSIETKYKQLLRKKKPTGDGDCPPDVKRAHRIEGLINQKADTRDLSDSEFDDAGAAGTTPPFEINVLKLFSIRCFVNVVSNILTTL